MSEHCSDYEGRQPTWSSKLLMSLYSAAAAVYIEEYIEHYTWAKITKFAWIGTYMNFLIRVPFRKGRIC